MLRYSAAASSHFSCAISESAALNEACSFFVSTPSIVPFTGTPTSVTSTLGLFMLMATRTATVDDSNPGALTVTSHKPPRSPRMAHSPFGSDVAVNSLGIADGLTARIVAALTGWPLKVFTEPVSRPTSWAEAGGTTAKTAQQAATSASRGRGNGFTRTPVGVCASLPSAGNAWEAHVHRNGLSLILA